MKIEWLKTSTNNIIKRLDYPMLGIFGFIIAVGLIMVYSASSMISTADFGHSYYYFQKQILFFGLGTVIMYAVLMLPTSAMSKWSIPFLISTIILTALVLIPGIGVQRGGATRWLNLGGMAFQPSELLKLSLVIFFAKQLSSMNDEDRKSLKRGFLPYLALLAFSSIILLGQKDFGSVVTISIVMLCMFFLNGTPISFLLSLAGLMVAAFVPMVLLFPYRMQRILSFLDPWTDSAGAGYQIIQSYVAFASGGLLGKGLGAGNQKLFYLPAGHTDFIFAVVAEELGFIGSSVIIVAFFSVFILGMKRVYYMTNGFPKVLGSGMLIMFMSNVFVNLFVVMGLLPTKGLTLPLLSAGGTSLVMNMIALAVILNVVMNKPPSPSQN